MFQKICRLVLTALRFLGLAFEEPGTTKSYHDDSTYIHSLFIAGDFFFFFFFFFSVLLRDMVAARAKNVGILCNKEKFGKKNLSSAPRFVTFFFVIFFSFLFLSSVSRLGKLLSEISG